MRVAMITPGALPVPAIRGGAVEVLTEYIVEGNEVDKRFEIDLYTISDDELPRYNFNYTSIIPVHISFFTKIINRICNTFYLVLHKRKWKTSFNRAVLKIIKNQEYDLVIIQNNLLIYEEIYKKTNNKRIVYVMHNDVNDGDATHKRMAEFMGKTAYKILAVSTYTKNNFLEICKEANVEVLYNCVDFDLFNNIDKSKFDLREKYSIDKDDYLFMFSGRIDRYKGVLELIKAFEQLDADNTKLLVVGKSWFDESQIKNDYTKEVIKESELISDKVIFTGLIPYKKMPLIYKMADCLVIPSIWEEPFGVVALEGMISKLPIISTKSGGLVEVLDSSYSVLINNDEFVIQSLKDAMKYAVIHKEEMIQKGEKGYNRINNWQAVKKDNYFKNFIDKVL